MQGVLVNDKLFLDEELWAEIKKSIREKGVLSDCPQEDALCFFRGCEVIIADDPMRSAAIYKVNRDGFLWDDWVDDQCYL